MKTNDEQYVLCGGIFFAILCEYRERSRGKHLKQEDLLYDLLKIINPELEKISENDLQNWATGTSRYKKCEKDLHESPFCLTRHTFKTRFEEEYSHVLCEMKHLCDKYFKISKNAPGYKQKEREDKNKTMIKCLIALIMNDMDNISLSQEFYIKENMGIVQKYEFELIEEVCLESFLLGIWYYIICVSNKHNTEGKDTFLKLFKQIQRDNDSNSLEESEDTNKKGYIYYGELTQNFNKEIAIYYITMDDEKNGSLNKTPANLNSMKSQPLNGLIPPREYTGHYLPNGEVYFTKKANPTTWEQIIANNKDEAIKGRNANSINQFGTEDSDTINTDGE